MAKLIGRFPAGSPEWHRARAQGLGGSEIAAVVGLSPLESRFSLWHRKAGNIGPVVEETPEMEWGKRLEDAVATKWLDEWEKQWPAFASLSRRSTYHHDDRPWQIANPDLLTESTLLEVKTSPFGDGWGDDGTDEVPPHVRCQAAWYGDVFGFDVVHVAVLIGGYDFRRYTIELETAELVWLRTEGRLFLDSIAAGDAPDIDEHGATYWAVRELHPDIEPEDVEVGDHVAEPYVAARHALKAAEAEEQRTKSVLADALGNGRRALWRGTPIASRQARGEGTPYVVAARNLPTIERTLT